MDKQIIINIVTSFTGFTLEQLKCKTRKRELVVARSLLYLSLRKYCDISITDCAKLLDYDHATVLHSLKAINNDIATNKLISARVNMLFNIIDFELLKINTLKNENR